uniref:hypothetical protein n=1 Tax=Streptobacillus moniliformis TaxID=34105 RepID=UPI000A835D43
TSKYIKELERAIGFKIETIQVDNGYEFVNDKDVTDREDGKILYSRKEFRSEEELIENVKRHERLYNNRAKKPNLPQSHFTHSNNQLNTKH